MDEVDESSLRDRLLGALVGRCAGCTLGAPVELQPVARVRDWARRIGQEFPPTRFWIDVERPDDPAYVVSTRREFLVDHMTAVPADDDIAYTLMGLLILERFGPGFTTDDVASAWIRWLPFAHTAERVSLAALRAGHRAREAADVDNPYVHMIGGDIRSDPWGYVAAGSPELAAELAHRDAMLTHRRTGVHAAMYFAAVIAAAFTIDDPAEALLAGLDEIPDECWFAREVRWALDAAPAVHDHRDAHALVAERFAGMHPVHSVNNACLVVFGVTLGGRDFTRAIGETVAMGFDNDCTAATVGSIVGAVIGIDQVPPDWWHPFHNRIRTYLVDHEIFEIDDVAERFLAQRRRLLGSTPAG